MENIIIKEVSAKEIETLQIIGKQTFFETFSQNNTQEDMDKYLNENFAIDKLCAELNNPGSSFFIAWDQERPVGYLKLNTGKAQTEKQDETAFEIERIYVLKEYHGKKVGQLLYEKAKQIALLKNADYIWLGVWEENPKAIKFYKKNGFLEFGKHIFKLGNDEQTDIMMKLELKE